MKRNWLGVILAAAFLLCAAGTTLISINYFFLVREVQSMQGYFNQINVTLNAAQSLADEAARYGRQHPGMEQMLQRLDIKSRVGTNFPAR